MEARGGERSHWAELRRRAEAALDGVFAESDSDLAGDARRAIQELRVAQAELEIQNEELRQARESLEISHKRYEVLFHNAPVGYVVLDRIGMMHQVNESFCRMVGVDPERLRQRALRTQVAADHQAAFDRRFMALLRGPGPLVIETRLQHGLEPRQIDVRLEGVLVGGMPGGGESSESLLVAVSDITESKSLEKQLREAQKLETVGRLAGGIAHDFNNALTVIQSTIDVARMDVPADGEVADYLLQIETAASRSSALVQQLLAFAHKGMAVPRVLDLREVLGPMRTMLRRLLPESVGFEWDIAPDLHNVRMDPVQIDQVLTNLVINARDAIEGPGVITVECGNAVLDESQCLPNPRAVAGDYVRIVVRDTGSGMEAATRDRAFEPFFTTKSQGKGTGLGLSTVYGIVAQNRGLISLDSEPGAGTTLTIHLPRTGEQAAGEDGARRGGDDLGGSEHVLLVEDDEQILYLTRRLLVRKGYRVTAFDHPAAALEWFRGHGAEVDMVLSDVVMPGRSGPAMVDELVGLRPDLPYAFMSGYLKDEVASRRLLEEDTVFIPKPFDSVTLLTAVRRVLNARSGA